MDWLDLNRKVKQDNNSYYFYETHNLTLASLYNVKNSCYFNSIIQSLFHTKPFVDYILHETYPLTDIFFSKFVALIKLMWTENCKFYPTDLYKIFVVDFKVKNYEQQDAHEAFLFILNKIHDVLKHKVVFKDFQQNKIIQDSLKDLQGVDMSIINRIFMGQLQERTQCSNVACRKMIQKFPSFLDIIVNIQENDTLMNLIIKSFAKREELEDWNCDACHTRGNALHKTNFWRLPKILMIVLGRFNDPSGKNTAKIDFPLTNLSLTELVLYPRVTDRTRVNYNYNLYSVICHRGTAEGGHYYNISKRYGYWLLFNDQNISLIKENDIITEDAYILLYERVET